jgi:large conductance mechanosensitive channel
MGMIQEFREFALKGNMVDMAVGIIIGGATATVVKSLVSDIIMPPIGLLIGGIKFSEYKIPLRPAAGDQSEVAIHIGSFIDNMIAFLIVAFVVFMLIKAMNSLRKKEEAAPAPPPASEVYLKQIRDALVKEKA